MDANQFYWHLGNRIVHSLLILGLWKEFGEKRHCTHLIPTPPLGGRAVIRFGHAALHSAEGQSAASSATNAKACVGQKHDRSRNYTRRDFRRLGQLCLAF
jgi:hypothetical protein